jgi:LEA14-like dessication related protein
MGRLGKVLIAIIVAALIVGGVAYYFLSRESLKGAVSVTGVELYVRPGDVSEANTPIEARISVDNSFPANVRIERGSLAISLSGLRLANVDIPAQEIRQGHISLAANVVIDNALIDDFWYRHLSQGEKSDVSIDGNITVNTPVGSVGLPIRFSTAVETKMFPVEQQLNREYDVGVLGKVVVRKAVVKLVNVTPYETRLRADITIENSLKAIPLYVNGIAFGVKTGGGTVLCVGEQESPKAIAPGETDTIAFSITIDNSKIPKLWVEHIRNREETKINVEIWLKVKVADKTVELFKENPLTISTELKTNIFKYKE